MFPFPISMPPAPPHRERRDMRALDRQFQLGRHVSGPASPLDDAPCSRSVTRLALAMAALQPNTLNTLRNRAPPIHATWMRAIVPSPASRFTRADIRRILRQRPTNFGSRTRSRTAANSSSVAHRSSVPQTARHRLVTRRRPQSPLLLPSSSGRGRSAATPARARCGGPAPSAHATARPRVHAAPDEIATSSHRLTSSASPSTPGS